tara:strand:- start:1317 stop:2231 length:915 start_codon:yes stop_codon:yes gene_type:complete
MAGFDVTSNYSGKAAGFYVNSALKEATSLDFITMIENIKYRSNIQKYSNAGLITAAGCDFVSAGDLTGTEAILAPTNLMVNLDLCKAELLDSFEALSMRAGAGAPPPASFDDYVISYMGEIIADGVEGMIWQGAGTAASFNGFSTTTTGVLAANADVVDVATVGGAGSAINVGNVIENFQNTVAAIPSAVYPKEDLYLYVSPKTWRLYIQAVSALTSFPYASMNEDYTKVFEGIKLAVCPGQANDTIVAAQKSNLFFGTDLISDTTRIQLMDMAQLDGSDNMRLVARFSGGVQTAIGGDVVFTS